MTKPSISKPVLWGSYLMSVLPVLMLLFSTVMKFLRPPEVIEGLAKYGLDANMALKLGVLELLCTLLYLVPRTSVLGAILLTGYLGGATCTHLMGGEPFLFPVILGMMLWAGLFLRDPRIRALIPLKRP